MQADGLISLNPDPIQIDNQGVQEAGHFLALRLTRVGDRRHDAKVVALNQLINDF